MLKGKPVPSPVTEEQAEGTHGGGVGVGLNAVESSEDVRSEMESMMMTVAMVMEACEGVKRPAGCSPHTLTIQSHRATMS